MTDRLSASRVCKLWNGLAMHPSLWKTVSLAVSLNFLKLVLINKFVNTVDIRLTDVRWSNKQVIEFEQRISVDRIITFLGNSKTEILSTPLTVYSSSQKLIIFSAELSRDRLGKVWSSRWSGSNNENWFQEDCRRTGHGGFVGVARYNRDAASLECDAIRVPENRVRVPRKPDPKHVKQFILSTVGSVSFQTYLASTKFIS